MKKLFISFLVISVMHYNAQNEIEIHLESDPGVVYNGQTILKEVSEAYVEIPMQLINNSINTIEIIFRRVILDSDVNFMDQFCDQISCYSCGSDSIWTSPLPNSIASGDSSLMKPQGAFSDPGFVNIRYYILNSVNNQVIDSVDVNLIYSLCSSTSTDTHTACNSYTWIDGNTYYSSNNTATTTLTNNAGCDSIIELDLTILDTIYSTDFQTTCNSYTWINGVTYNESTNIPTYTFESNDGCDSIVTLNLTFLNSSSDVDFSSNVDSLTTSPFLVEFNNTTPNISDFNFTWIFGDGIILESNDQLVYHEYLYNGLYNVTLIAESISTGCVDTMYQPDFIYCTGGSSMLPVCDFIASNTQISSGNTINFYDLTQNNPTSWMWTFEGGSPSFSTNKNPSGIIYNSNGVYDVTLIATNSGGSDTLTKLGYINVNNSLGLISNFTSNIKIYPNPTENLINIDINNYNGQIYSELYDIIGNLIIKTNNKTVDLCNYANGIYFLKVVHEDKITKIKLIKE